MKNEIKDSATSEFVSKLKQQCNGLFKSITVKRNSKINDGYQTWITCKMNVSVPTQKVNLYAERFTKLCNSFVSLNRDNIILLGQNGQVHDYEINSRKYMISSVIIDMFHYIISYLNTFDIYLEDYSETIHSHDSFKIVNNSHLLNLIKDAQINNTLDTCKIRKK